MTNTVKRGGKWHTHTSLMAQPVLFPHMLFLKCSISLPTVTASSVPDLEATQTEEKEWWAPNLANVWQLLIASVAVARVVRCQEHFIESVLSVSLMGVL